jgi:hypothetical protein
VPGGGLSVRNRVSHKFSDGTLRDFTDSPTIVLAKYQTFSFGHERLQTALSSNRRYKEEKLKTHLGHMGRPPVAKGACTCK